MSIALLIVGIQLIITHPLTANPKNEKGNSAIFNSIVQVYTVNRTPYYLNPWITLPDIKSRGSGSIIEGNKILTSAHVVANHASIEVRKSMDSKKYKARVVNISHEADLAILTVDDETFFSDVRALEVGTLPDVQQMVSIYGFPEGETLNITEGLLSQIEHRKYTHSSNYLLAGEILSEIKSGHSGGPVIFNNNIIGVMMQANKSGSVAHMVPAPVIQHVFNDLDDGRYDGFPNVGLVTQSMEDHYLKGECSIRELQRGIAVRHVISGSPAEGMIMKDDILLAVNGYRIGDDGTIEFRPGERTHHNYSVEMRQLGDKINMEILRDCIISNVALTLNKRKEDFLLIPGEQYDRKPRYFIFGGVVFSPLTKNYINEWESAPEALVAELSKWPTRDRQEIVVALLVLPDEVNKGYHDVNSWMITEVNGRSFKDFNEFFDIVTTSSDPYLIFKDEKGSQVVIDRLQAEENHERILQTYSISEDHSPDLKLLHAAKYPASTTYQ
jgi:S1-C subfamily serine protease